MAFSRNSGVNPPAGMGRRRGGPPATTVRRTLRTPQRAGRAAVPSTKAGYGNGT
jgi:hypothetical protein